MNVFEVRICAAVNCQGSFITWYLGWCSFSQKYYASSIRNLKKLLVCVTN